MEADRVVPSSGNLQLGGQQIWLGPALADRKVTIWVDETSLHVLLDGARIKTLPSRLGLPELARLAASGARPAGPSPLLAGTGTVVEVERTVNACGLAGLAGAQFNVGYQLAGQRVIVRMDGTQMMVITDDGELARTMPCPVPAGDRLRLRGARKAAASPAPRSGPVTVQRRVSSRGGIMVARSIQEQADLGVREVPPIVRQALVAQAVAVIRKAGSVHGRPPGRHGASASARG